MQFIVPCIWCLMRLTRFSPLSKFRRRLLGIDEGDPSVHHRQDGHCAPPSARANAVRRLAHTAVGADAHGLCWPESKEHFGQAINYRRAYGTRSSKVPDHARSIAVAAERIARTDHTFRHYGRHCCRRVAFARPRCAQQASRSGSQRTTAETHYGSRHIQASLTGPVRHATRAPPDQPPCPQPE